MSQEPQRRKTPYEKKQDEYDRSRLGDKEWPHLFRKAKPRKKKGVNRQERSRVRDLVTNALKNSEEENLTVAALEKIAEPIGFPWKGAVTVRTLVERKAKRRSRPEAFSNRQKPAHISPKTDV